jgi:hypothetical protein
MGGHRATCEREKMINMIEEIKETFKMEIRPNSQELEYLEAVLQKKDLQLLIDLLEKHLGTAAKEPGKEANLPREIQELVNALGGLRNEQSFFYRQDGHQVIFAAIWPWQFNPDKLTLKSGIWEIGQEPEPIDPP